MSVWIPLFQAMLWPLCILVVIFTFRGHVLQLLRSINSRVQNGAEFEVGRDRLRVGPSLDAPPELEPAPAASTQPRVRLVHVARRAPEADRGGQKYYRFEIFLVDDGYGELGRVTKVVYHLHPTFRDPDRTVTDREDNFVLETVGWGMFNLTADVYSKGRDEPLRLERYLNF